MHKSPPSGTGRDSERNIVERRSSYEDPPNPLIFQYDDLSPPSSYNCLRVLLGREHQTAAECTAFLSRSRDGRSQLAESGIPRASSSHGRGGRGVSADAHRGLCCLHQRRIPSGGRRLGCNAPTAPCVATDARDYPGELLQRGTARFGCRVLEQYAPAAQSPQRVLRPVGTHPAFPFVFRLGRKPGNPDGQNAGKWWLLPVKPAPRRISCSCWGAYQA